MESYSSKGVKMLFGLSPEPKQGKILEQTKVFSEAYRKVDIVNLFTMWDSRDIMLEAFSNKVNMVIQNDYIPMVSWYLNTSNVETTPPNVCDLVTQGHYDEYISKFLSSLSPESEMYLRLNHEPNVVGRHYNDPKNFIKVWNYLAPRIRKALPKAKLTWCANDNDLSSPKFEEYMVEDVDYVGFDSYKWSNVGPTEFNFIEPMRRIKAISSKPIIVSEFGTRFFKKEGGKVYIDEVTKYLENEGVFASLYFNGYDPGMMCMIVKDKTFRPDLNYLFAQEVDNYLVR